MKEPPSTNEELALSIGALFIAAHQSALFAYWSLIRQPLLRKFGELGIPEAEIHFSTGILESSLILIRKTTEFFRAKSKNDKIDSLYAYQYLPDWCGSCVVDDATYRELHKRIGHITVREVRHGQIEWQILPMTIGALNQWIDFFRLVGRSSVFEANPPTDQLHEFVVTLVEISDKCSMMLKRRVTS
jgi:hypothetical protein